MKAVFRFLVTAIGLLLIVLAIGAILASTQAGAFADAAFERMLGYIYQTDVTIEHVVFLPRDRAMVMQGVTIHNPPPFKEGPAIEIGELLVRADATTLVSAKPTVHEVVMKDAEFRIRYEVGRGTNLGKLDENANRFNTTSFGTSEPILAKREYVIKSFRSEAAKLDLSANFIPGSSLTLDIAPFTLEELSSSTPVSTTQMGSLFIRSLLREAITVRGLMKPIADRLNEELERLGESSPTPEKTPVGTV